MSSKDSSVSIPSSPMAGVTEADAAVFVYFLSAEDLNSNPLPLEPSPRPHVPNTPAVGVYVPLNLRDQISNHSSNLPSLARCVGFVISLVTGTSD